MPLVFDATSPNGGLVIDHDEREYTPQTTFICGLKSVQLNGRGGARGRINKNLHPAATQSGFELTSHALAPSSRQNKDDDYTHIFPVAAINAPVITRAIELGEMATTVARRNGEEPMFFRRRPGATTVDVTDAIDGGVDGHRYFFDVVPQTIILREKKLSDDSGRTTTNRNTDVMWRAILWTVTDEDRIDTDVASDGSITRTITDSDHDAGDVMLPNCETAEPTLYQGITVHGTASWGHNPAEMLQGLLCDVVKHYDPQRAAHTMPTVDPDVFANLLGEGYPIYDVLCDAAEEVRTEAISDSIGDIIDYAAAMDMYLDAAMEAGKTDRAPSMSYVYNNIAGQLRLIEHWEITLEAYQKLYLRIKALEDTYPGPKSSVIVEELIKQNTQLALNGNLLALHELRDELPVPGTPPAGWSLDPMYSAEQVEAITTDSPLSIVLAGAGTGKSTVIGGRINFLTAGGTPSEDIMAVSFTNAAADTLAARYPGVTSITIASMIHDNYQANFDHNTTEIETLVNTIGIYYRDQVVSSDFLSTFIRLLHAVGKDQSSANVSRLSGFAETYTKEVIEVLDTVGQTTLELEIILSYLLIDSMVDHHTPPKHLIIDEVQDNSSFEFVYVLRYAAKHRTSLYLVGDSSQTLYEFRAANPKALNALEGSGIFGTHRLTTNYRSNQEILDFANIHLDDIDANRYARIQLRANSLERVTEKSFKDKVQLQLVPMSMRESMAKNLDWILGSSSVIEWIHRNVEAGEQTIVLARSRAEVKAAKEAIQGHWPHIDVVDLTSQRSYPSTIFSDFVYRWWDEVTAVDPAAAAFTFHNQVLAHLGELERNAITKLGEEKIREMTVERLAKWWSANQANVTGWTHQHQAGTMSAETFFGSLRECILQFEANTNRSRQQQVSQRNDERKRLIAERKPLLLVSTVHGSKGMEFDHVLVLRKESLTPTSEETKRLHYVALTRAKLSELIIAVTSNGTTAPPRIKSDWDVIVDGLRAADEAHAAKEAAIAQQLAVDAYMRSIAQLGGDASDIVPMDVDDADIAQWADDGGYQHLPLDDDDIDHVDDGGAIDGDEVADPDHDTVASDDAGDAGGTDDAGDAGDDNAAIRTSALEELRARFAQPIG